MHGADFFFFQLTRFSFDGCENNCTYLIITIESEILIISHFLGLGDETIVCTECLAVFLQSILHLSDLRLRLIGVPRSG